MRQDKERCHSQKAHKAGMFSQPALPSFSSPGGNLGSVLIRIRPAGGQESSLPCFNFVFLFFTARLPEGVGFLKKGGGVTPVRNVGQTP